MISRWCNSRQIWQEGVIYQHEGMIYLNEIHKNSFKTTTELERKIQLYKYRTVEDTLATEGHQPLSRC